MIDDSVFNDWIEYYKEKFPRMSEIELNKIVQMELETEEDAVESPHY